MGYVYGEEKERERRENWKNTVYHVKNAIAVAIDLGRNTAAREGRKEGLLPSNNPFFKVIEIMRNEQGEEACQQNITIDKKRNAVLLHRTG